MLRQNSANHTKEEKGNILRSKIKNITCLICLLCTILLCDICPFSASALTIGKERELAEKYMKVMKDSGLIIRDPIISNMVTGVGNKIVAILPPQTFKYSFYVLNADSFNAFAIPGANIFIHRGLITSLDTVDELAGIIAHETAHSACRHIAQLIDKSKIVSVATLAGMIAGIVVSSKGDGELGKALTMGSAAAGKSAMLSYTREHETEADQKGFDYLLKTDFSPTGLLTSLKKIRKADFYGTDDIPDYFKTHPGTRKRIASLEIMLARYSDKPIPKSPDYNFEMIKYRAIGLFETSIKATKIFTRLLRKNPDNAAYHYGYAIALIKQLKTDKAYFHLKKALAVKPFDPLILLEISNILLHNDQPGKALDILNSIKNSPVLGTAAYYSLGRAFLGLNNSTAARENFNKVICHPGTAVPKTYYYLAELYSRGNNPGLKHYYLGYYYFEIKNRKNTRVHLKKALKTLKDKEKIKKANEILKEVKKESLL